MDAPVVDCEAGGWFGGEEAVAFPRPPTVKSSASVGSIIDRYLDILEAIIEAIPLLVLDVVVSIAYATGLGGTVTVLTKPLGI